MPARYAWGLDIGQSGIRAVEVHRRKEGAEITDLFIHPLETQPDDPEYNEKVRAGLQRFMKEKDVGSTTVVAALPGYATLFRNVSLPAVGAGKLAEIVSYEAKQVIPYPLEEVIWDYHCLSSDEESGESDVAIVCCRKDIIASFLETLDAVGMNVEALQIGPLGWVNYLLFESPPEGATLLLDVGARGTDLIILHEESFWLRSIGVSGGDITRTLMTKFSIPFEEAEGMKVGLAENKQADRVFKVIRPVLRNLCGEVGRSIGYFKSLYRGVEISGVMCAGRTFLIPGFDQFLADNLRYAVQGISEPSTIHVASTVDSNELSANLQLVGKATGLALQGVGLSKVKINLLPRERLFDKLIAAKVKYAIAALLFLAVATALAFVQSSSRAPLFEKLVAEIQTATQQAQNAQAKLKQMEEAFKPARTHNRALASIALTRGMLLDAAAATRAVIDRINNERAEKVKAIQAEYNKKTSLAGHPIYGDAPQKMYDQLVKQWEKDLTEEGMKENIRDQVRYYYQWLTERRGRIVIEKETYKVVKVIQGKVAEGDPLTWRKLSQMDLDALAEGRTSELGFTVEGSPSDAVEVSLQGFVVTDKGEDVIQIKDRLSVMPGILVQPIDFPPLDRRKKNTIMLPVIQKPEATILGADVLPEEEGKKKKEEVAAFKAEDESKDIIGFQATFLYRPEPFNPPLPSDEPPAGEKPEATPKAAPSPSPSTTEPPPGTPEKKE